MFLSKIAIALHCCIYKKLKSTWLIKSNHQSTTHIYLIIYLLYIQYIWSNEDIVTIMKIIKADQINKF